MTNWGLSLDSRTENVGISSGDGVSHTCGNGAKAASPTTIGAAGHNWHGFVLYAVPLNNSRYRIDVEIGASNTVICEDLYLDASGAGANVSASAWFIPIPIPSGTDIKVRGMCSIASQTFRASVMGFQTDFRGYQRARRMICINSWSTLDPGTIISDTGTTETTPPTEITSSLSQRVSGIYLTPAAGGDTARNAGRRTIRLWTGGAGSERAVWTSMRASAANQQMGAPEGPFPLSFRAGTRLSYTVLSTGASADSIGVAVHGLVV
jgi:hypothetical protein